jgi:hypothetical protein
MNMSAQASIVIPFAENGMGLAAGDDETRVYAASRTLELAKVRQATSRPAAPRSNNGGPARSQTKIRYFGATAMD